MSCIEYCTSLWITAQSQYTRTRIHTMTPATVWLQTSPGSIHSETIGSALRAQRAGHGICQFLFVMPTSEELNDHERKTEVAEKPLADEAEPDEAVACHVCNMWLNGQEAYDVHIRGNTAQEDAQKAACDGAPRSFLGHWLRAGMTSVPASITTAQCQAGARQRRRATVFVAIAASGAGSGGARPSWRSAGR